MVDRIARVSLLQQAVLYRLVLWFLVVSGLVVAQTLSSASAVAQGNSRAVPKRDYFLAKSLLDEGQFATALEGFRSAARGGIRSTEGRWVDSICYHAMMGECHYQLGQPRLALERFTAALELYVAHRDWLLRVQFPPAIGAAAVNPRNAVNWGVSARRMKVGKFPDKLLSMQGDPNVEAAVRRGGVIAPPEFFPLFVDEIVRCTALAIRRRNELMGPTCPHHPLTSQLVAALARRPAPPNHWSQAWVSVLLGLAYAGDNKVAQALSELQRGLVTAGDFDHPLTGIALVELGKLALRQGKLPDAARYFQEATYSAAAFNDYAVMEEAFRKGALVHMVSGGKGVYGPLARATAWAHRQSRFLEMSLLVSAAENFNHARQGARAAALLGKARRWLNRNEMAQSQVGARYKYQSALIGYQKGNVKLGDEAYASVLAFQRNASLRLFHIGLVDNLFVTGGLGQRVAVALYDQVLREPTARDWLVEPVETLAFQQLAPTLPMEHWFEVTMMRKEHEKALEIADRVRRHRFYSALARGGRLLALRWVLEAPPEALSPKAALQRQDLLARFPQYAQLRDQAVQVQAQLDGLPLLPADEPTGDKQKEGLAQLAKLAAGREILLREMALHRVASELAFPPRRSVKDVQRQLADGQLVLAFFSTQRNLYAFALSQSRYAHWQVESPNKIREELVQLLRNLGHHDKNLALDRKELANTDWKLPARRLLQRLMKNARDEVWDAYDELVIVPDGLLWYLPFEALQVGESRTAEPLLMKLRIRYAPTLGLVLPDGRKDKPLARSAIVSGRLFPRDRDETGKEAAKQIQGVLPGSAILPDSVPGGGALFAHQCDRLIVLEDLDGGRLPFDWTPLPQLRGRMAASLQSWLPLPWGGPHQVVLPGFHTPAEHALKRSSNPHELFVAMCGLMATGTRSILLSRWRTGGQTSYDLIREYAQELPHRSAARAWQRSVRLAMSNELDPDREPRVHAFAGDVGLKADHPFFWSGYMLIDSGSEPTK